MDQSPLSTQILAPSGATLRVNSAWKELWGLSLDDIADYNLLHDPQLDAQGVTPLLRRAFAGEAVSLPAVRYDPEHHQSAPEPPRGSRALGPRLRLPGEGCQRHRP